MCKENLREIFTDLTKGMEKSDMFSVAQKILNAYYKNIYTGTEHDHISLMYMDKVYMELVFWLGKNANKIKTESKHGSILKNFFQKHILSSRINTYGRREKLYELWINGAENCDVKSDFMCYLFSVYNEVNEENIKNVRKELDLTLSLGELKQIKKGLK